jgi:hypothetical protein
VHAVEEGRLRGAYEAGRLTRGQSLGHGERTRQRLARDLAPHPRGQLQIAPVRAVSTVPSTAMPSAPPSSNAVSDTAAAAPARSRGAVASTLSLLTVNANPMPIPPITIAGTSVR